MGSLNGCLIVALTTLTLHSGVTCVSITVITVSVHTHFHSPLRCLCCLEFCALTAVTVVSQQMAEPNRTIRVCGLPTDMNHDRLRDKLLIHFLRKRNGGGEIQSINIVQASPASALIAFEENEGQDSWTECILIILLSWLQNFPAVSFEENSPIYTVQ